MRNDAPVLFVLGMSDVGRPHDFARRKKLDWLVCKLQTLVDVFFLQEGLESSVLYTPYHPWDERYIIFTYTNG